MVKLPALLDKRCEKQSDDYQRPGAPMQRAAMGLPFSPFTRRAVSTTILSSRPTAIICHSSFGKSSFTTSLLPNESNN
jgi:hypothetical protein